jgi:peroxiredoxin
MSNTNRFWLSPAEEPMEIHHPMLSTIQPLMRFRSMILVFVPACAASSPAPQPSAPAPSVQEDQLTRDLRQFQDSWSELLKANSDATEASIDRGGPLPPALDPSALLDEYSPRIAPYADQGDPRALAWCLRFSAFPCPGNHTFDTDRLKRLSTWWKSFQTCGAEDETIAHVVRDVCTISYLLDDTASGCIVLAEKARDPEVKARALEAAMELSADKAKQTQLRTRLADEFPGTVAGRRAADDLRQLEVLKEGQSFPGYASRRFIDLAAAIKSNDPDPEALMKDPRSTFALSDYRGKVVALIFGDDYCGFCKAEIPFERDMLERLKPRGFEIIGVYTDADVAHVVESRKMLAVTWPSLWDVPGTTRNGPLCRELGVHGVPLTVVLDRNGIVRAVGPRTQQLEAAVERVLASSDSRAQ